MKQSNVVAAPSANISLKRGDRSIGAILIDAGRLKVEAAESILRLQREQGLRFGDAAIQLGLLTKEDIDFAIARQFDYPYLLRGQSAVSEDLVAAYAPFTPQVEALRALRSQLMLRWFDADVSHKALAVVSAERKEGRSSSPPTSPSCFHSSASTRCSSMPICAILPSTSTSPWIIVPVLRLC